MKILFVHGNEDRTADGGTMISNRNRNAIKAVCGAENVDSYEIQGDEGAKVLWCLYLRCARKYTNQLGQTDVDTVCAQAELYDCIWLDNSCYGAMAKALKNEGYKGLIIVFFHNIERVFLHRPLWQRMFPFVYRNPIVAAERLSARCADRVVVLTERDRQGVIKLHADAHTVIMPSSLPDAYKEMRDSASQRDDTVTMLFVGSHFRANVNGISWFIDNVLLYVNAKLVVIGSGMDKLPYVNNDRLEIHGFVNDTSQFYHDANFVVAPIFEGSGMKTKTTEALMWGKYVIGTVEAFCGFDITDREGMVCSDAQSFIKAINKLCALGISKFNLSSRKLYLEKYSMASSVETMKTLLSQGGSISSSHRLPM